MPKVIGIGYDGSDMGKKAIDTAIELFGNPENTFVIISAYEIASTQPPFGYTLEEAAVINNKRRTAMENLISTAVTTLREKEIPYKIILEGGDPRTLLCFEATEQKCDYLVIGTHGYSTLRGFFAGSTSHHCVQASPCTVIVVK